MEQNETSELPEWLRPQEEEVEPEIDWLVAEARRNTFRVELQRLKRRAKKKPFLLMFITSLLVMVVLFKMSRKVHVYQATIIMRATESQLIDEESPFAGEGLANYLFSIALSRDRLMPIIEKFDLVPERETFGDLYAVDEIRGALDIETSSNAFARARDDGDPLRTVGISIHYFDTDPELAFAVATALSSVLIVAEQERRTEAVIKLKKIADTTVVAVESRMSNLNSRVAEKMLLIDELKGKSNTGNKIAAAQISVRRMNQDITQLGLTLIAMVGNQEQVALAVAAENAELGFQIDVIDVERPEYIPRKSKVIYAMLGIFLFICLVPIVAIGISAIDSKLHHIDDLLRLELPVVGHMPGFPGDSKGSLKERNLRTKDRA